MYKLLLSEVVKKQCKNIPRKDLEKIKNIVSELRKEPRPRKCKKLSGGKQEYRIRYRYWRILYSVYDNNNNNTIVVYGVLSRKEAYR